MMEEECWDSGWIWGMKWKRIGGLEGAWFQGEKEGGSAVDFRGRRRSLLGEFSLDFSVLSLGWKKALEEVLMIGFIRTHEAAGRTEDFESLRRGHCS